VPSRVSVSTDPEAWLTAHAAFIVPIAFALLRVDVQPHRLAADEALVTRRPYPSRTGRTALACQGIARRRRSNGKARTGSCGPAGERTGIGAG
jgi:hypothetical protein